MRFPLRKDKLVADPFSLQKYHKHHRKILKREILSQIPGESNNLKSLNHVKSNPQLTLIYSGRIGNRKRKFRRLYYIPGLRHLSKEAKTESQPVVPDLELIPAVLGGVFYCTAKVRKMRAAKLVEQRSVPLVPPSVKIHVWKLPSFN